MQSKTLAQLQLDRSLLGWLAMGRDKRLMGICQVFAVLVLLRAPAEADSSTEREVPVAGAAALNWVMGFGAGHAMQGRWLERGWIFTAADTVGAGFLLYAASQVDSCFLVCSREDLDTRTEVALGVGITVLTVSRIAAIADAVHGGLAHNRRVREARTVPYVAPSGDGASAGLVMRF